MSQAKPRRKKPHDFAILGGPTEDGRGAQLLRFRGDSVSVGEIRPAREGEPITHSELVRLHPLDAERRICQVEVLHAPAQGQAEGQAPRREPEPEPRAALGDGLRGSDPSSERPAEDSLSRPPRVATERYRKNWDAIFDKRAKRKATWDVN
jgi:hypothetical protein